MNRATTVMWTLATLLAAGTAPAAAQVIVGGTGNPSVEVNWSVLERLGQAPNIAGMVRREEGYDPGRPASAAEGVAFRPYGGETTKPAKGKGGKLRLDAEAAPVEAVKLHKPTIPPKPDLSPPMIHPVKAEKPAKVDAAPKAVPPVAAPEVPKPEVAAAPVASTPVAPAPVAPTPAPVAEKPVQIARVEPVAPPAPPPAPVVPAVAPAPQPEAAPAKPVSTAPAAPVIRKGDNVAVVFGNDSADLPDAARPDLVGLAKKMEKDDSLALQLLAFAAGSEADASKARRLSLSRALKVRTFLMEQGVRSTRIEVRALGNKVEGDGPADRVDAILTVR